MIVYTAHIGDTDPLLEPLVIEEGVKYWCFTDRADLKSDVWKIIRIDLGPSNIEPYNIRHPRTQARFLKIAEPTRWSEPITIWIDGTYRLLQKPSEIVHHLGDYDMLAMAHPWRDNIIDEGAAIINGHGEDLTAVDRQIRAYQDAGFNLHSESLTTTGFLVRRHNKIANRFCRVWWQELQKYHLRDQMSVDYCAYETCLEIGYLYGHYRNNPYVRYYHHGGTKAKLLDIKNCEAPGRKFVNA